MHISSIVLLPPVLVMVLAFLTRRILFALVVGIVAAALILNDFYMGPALSTIVNRLIASAELYKLLSWESLHTGYYIFICLFLLTLGVLINVIRRSGGAYAYGRFVINRLQNARNAETSSLFLSLFFFIDDYFSTLTVGSVMQPITDQFRVPRIKLAFLVNIAAVPLVTLMPLSSWVAEIVGQFRQSGISSVSNAGTLIISDPFYLYFQLIPYLFYPLIILLSAWYLVRRRLSFGIIARHEKEAAASGNLFAGKIPVTRKMKDLDPIRKSRCSLWDFLLPIVILVGLAKFFILQGGGFYLLGGSRGMLEALQYSNIPLALFKAGLISLGISLLFLLVRFKLSLHELPGIVVEGFGLMLPSVMMLVLVWTLSGLLKNDLPIGAYLAHLVGGYIDIVYFPVIFYVLTMFTTLMMGSSWGAMGILIPIAVPMLVSCVGFIPPVSYTEVPMLLPMLGAIISGAATGNHLSPFAEVSVMAATSAGAYHMDLVRALFSIVIPCAFFVALAFFMIGVLGFAYSGVVVGLAAAAGGLILNILFMQLRAAWENKKSQ